VWCVAQLSWQVYKVCDFVNQLLHYVHAVHMTWLSTWLISCLGFVSQGWDRFKILYCCNFVLYVIFICLHFWNFVAFGVIHRKKKRMLPIWMRVSLHSLRLRHIGSPRVELSTYFFCSVQTSAACSMSIDSWLVLHHCHQYNTPHAVLLYYISVGSMPSVIPTRINTLCTNKKHDHLFGNNLL